MVKLDLIVTHMKIGLTLAALFLSKELILVDMEILYFLLALQAINPVSTTNKVTKIHFLDYLVMTSP